MAGQSSFEDKAVIGNDTNYWLHTDHDNSFDLRRPSPGSEATSPRLDIKTSTTSITVDPSKTALVIIDMQNFFLSPALGRKQGAGHKASTALEKHAIPAARKAGIQIIWLNWGLTEKDISTMPPSVKRAFGFEVVPSKTKPGAIEATTEQPQGSKTLHPSKNPQLYKGLGTDLGTVELDGGRKVGAGKMLMRDQWNSALYPPLDAMYEEGTKLARKADVWKHKDRMSGLWGARTECEDFLREQGLTTLLFAGVNTDQCVCGSLADAYSKGFDCILLRDGCGTTSPDFAQEGVEFNAARSWGFVSTCEDVAKGVEAMKAS